jgi:thiaminase/transcriptional activator TenA
MKTLGKFTEKLWQSILPLYEEILEDPFVMGLSDGTLPKPCFAHYLAQDILYVKDDSLALEILSARSPFKEQEAFFQLLAREGYEMERIMHREYLSIFNVEEAGKKSPVIEDYTVFLLGHAEHSSYSVAASALLPCFWVYLRVGKKISAGSVPGNPYQKWIDTYESEGFEDQVEHFIEIVEILGQNAGNKTGEAMVKAFLESTRYELHFFQESWSINPKA